MKKLLLLWGMVSLLVACNQTPGEKTAYADVQKLAKSYHEIQQVEKEMKAKEEVFKKKYDSIGQVLQSKYQKFLQRANRMPQKKAQAEYNKLMAEQQQLGMMQQQELQQLQEELNKKRDEALKKMEEKIEEYGKKNGYTYIFNKGDFGLLYGEESKDITDDLSRYLNGGEAEAKDKKHEEVPADDKK